MQYNNYEHEMYYIVQLMSDQATNCQTNFSHYTKMNFKLLTFLFYYFIILRKITGF